MVQKMRVALSSGRSSAPPGEPADGKKSGVCFFVKRPALARNLRREKRGVFSRFLVRAQQIELSEVP